MEITCSLKRFRPWGQAAAVFERIEMAGKLAELERYLEDLYGSIMSGSDLNDLLAYDNEQLLQCLGLEETEEDLQECFISKLNEQLSKALSEDQYEGGFDEEEYYVVTFEDGTKDNDFMYGDFGVYYKDAEIGNMLNNNWIMDNDVIAQIIVDYCAKFLNKHVVKIEDGVQQVIYGG